MSPDRTPTGPLASASGSASGHSPATGFWLVISIIITLAVAKAVVADVHDPDFFWHIRVAEQLEREGIHPIVDHLSYSSIKTPWTPYSWLAELAMKHIWDAGGIQLTLLARCAMVIAIILFITLACRQLAGRDRPMPTIVAMVFFAWLSFPYLSYRPATAAMVLLAITIWLLLRDRKLNERSRAVWLVIPITALCVNIHLTAIVIPMWVAALLLGAITERNQSKIQNPKSKIRYTALLIACGLALLATPMLKGVIQSTWNYQHNDVLVASGLITEMQPIYQGIVGKVTMLILALFFFCAYRGRESLRSGEWFLLAVGTILMFRLGRFAPLFAMTASPILAATLPNLSDKPLRHRAIQVVTAIALVTFLYRVIEQFPARNTNFCAWLNRPDLQFHYPCESADWVEQNIAPQLDNRTGRLINDFTSGGYLEWRLGPTFQTLMDGRTQLFPADFWNQTLLAPDDKSRAKFIDKQHADAAILPTKKSAFRAAIEQLGWKKVHSDPDAEVYVPPNSPR